MSDEEFAAAPSLTPLRGNRNFQLLWTGQLLSLLGTEMGVLAYPLVVLFLTRSPVFAGTIGTVASAAAFVTRLPARVLVAHVAPWLSMGAFAVPMFLTTIVLFVFPTIRRAIDDASRVAATS